MGYERGDGAAHVRQEGSQIFLTRELARHQDYSKDTARVIDQEVKRIVSANYARAQKILIDHKAVLGWIADELLVREVLDAEQVRRIVAGLPVDDPQRRMVPIRFRRRTPAIREPRVCNIVQRIPGNATATGVEPPCSETADPGIPGSAVIRLDRGQINSRMLYH